MKTILFFLIIFCTVVSSAFGQLTIQELRFIVKEEIEGEVNPIKSEISSVKENVASLNGRVGGIEKQITWLMAIIIVAVVLPQVIIAWRSRKDPEQARRIEELAEEIETLKQQRTVNP